MTETTCPPAHGAATASDDEVLLSDLRRAANVADPVPDGWRAAGSQAFAWAAVEAHPAALVYDSLPVRGGVGTRGGGPAQRSLRYTAGTATATVTVEIDLDIGADKVRAVGRVRPLVPSAVVALTTDGLVDGDCDPSGAFRFDELPRRPFCLVVTAPGRSVKTGWVVA